MAEYFIKIHLQRIKLNCKLTCKLNLKIKIVIHLMSTPLTESDLLHKAQALAGKTLAEIALLQNKIIPNQLIHAKGWIGQILESALGANAGNLDAADFIDLGIELKTLPITTQGKLVESTYVCKISLPWNENNWLESRVWRKLSRVLWVPIEACPNKPLGQQRIGTPIIWSPDLETYNQLKQDWEELTELICLGHYDKINAHLGVYLQIRPKAPNSSTLVETLNTDAEEIAIVPIGFYLRTQLTQRIVAQYYEVV